MIRGFLEKCTVYLSNHFEWFIYISIALAILFLIFIVALRLSDTSQRIKLHSAFRTILYSMVIGGQLFLILILGFNHWSNQKKPVIEVKLETALEPSTRWVRDNRRIYYIDDTSLKSIELNGKNRKVVFESQEPVQEYHFSPNGKFLLVLTLNDLHLIKRKTNKSLRIAGLEGGGQNSNNENIYQGSISGIQWSPDSSKFIYEIARWSKFATHDNVYIYSIDKQTIESIKSPTRRISSLHWNIQSDALYYLQHESVDPLLNSEMYEVKVFRIPLETLDAELTLKVPSQELSVPITNLDLRGVELFLGEEKYSFGRYIKEDHLESPTGSLIGIDEDDFLYYIDEKQNRKRLFKVLREQNSTDSGHYYQKGGDLIIDQFRWIPGGRYVIMNHKHWGVCVLEPSSEQLGVLVHTNGHTFGWYE